MGEQKPVIFLEGTEPDGIRFKVSYQSPNILVEAGYPNQPRLQEQFYPTHEPRFGIDMADAQYADEIIDNLCAELRKHA